MCRPCETITTWETGGMVSNISTILSWNDRLCGLVVRVPGYRMEIYCVSREVRTEFICYVTESRTPLWSSGQSSWLQIQRSQVDSRCYQIFWEVVGVEQGPLSLISTIDELLGRSSSSSGLESWKYGCRGSVALTMWHPLSTKVDTDKRWLLRRYNSLVD
jgi:hypothetical protein